jgi:hypothetical protein
MMAVKDANVSYRYPPRDAPPGYAGAPGPDGVTPGV